MKLFWRIFLSFWIGTVLMIVAILSVNETLSLQSSEDHRASFQPEVAESALTEAVNLYENRGKHALDTDLLDDLSLRNRHVYLVGEDGQVLAGTGDPPLFYRQLAREELQGGHATMQRSFGTRMLFACSIHSASGRRYAAVLTAFDPALRILRPRFWFNLSIAMFPSALVCFLLSLYITRPITRLRATAQRLAEGDLAARSSAHRVARRDELGDLARDFDMMAARIEQLMTAQRRFVADISHELGAPLTRMHLALALLRREFMGGRSAGLERIERETDKLSNLAQQLLLLAGLEAGRCPAETLTPISLRSLCESMIEDASFEADHASCRIGGSCEDATMLAYPRLLRRAIDNVLRNAIRYTSPGTEVLLNCRVNEKKSEVLIDILDSGPGVPESMLKEIFLPFFRTAPGRESDSGGTGLGLAIAAEAVRLHNGTISAQNREGGGLHVKISLPLGTGTTEELQGSDRSVKV